MQMIGFVLGGVFALLIYRLGRAESAALCRPKKHSPEQKLLEKIERFK